MVAGRLLDLNVLLALAWQSHEHHDSAHAWFSRQRSSSTCGFTQMGFVRLSSNPRVVDPVASPAEAAEVLRRILQHPRHLFWVDDLDIGADGAGLPAWVQGHRQVSDAHLVRLAARHKGRVATFDGALHAAAGGGLVELIAAS